eukprot:GHVT01078410.1.p1 GENE.GHVT01078410.1~~GHVT01078410.1.p1  ORF type:complete len:492 (+),score=109.77 GHVT01078410.1:221-1477(+)
MTMSLRPLIQKFPKYLGVLETIAEPEGSFTFRIPWLDDEGVQRINRGYRVQFSSALGPFKGGLRFHPTVTLSVMKFLGFEQIFKNSLTGLPLGGAKGGSDFDPKGKSDAEILRFCQSFMVALAKHIGPSQDVPAGDIGVGAREIGYLYGQYKRLTSHFEGALTGKDPKWGGSNLRPEATGYGAVMFAAHALQAMGKSFAGLRCAISGSGNVALFCAERLLASGVTVLTLSDSTGYVVEPLGFSAAQLEMVKRLKITGRERISAYCKLSRTASFVPGRRPWEVACDVAFPCATQNEIDIHAAQLLIENKCKMVVEGANMPTTNDAIALFKSKGVVLCPAKAANAGGVAVSGLEMAQNAMRVSWSRARVEEELKKIMKSIFDDCQNAAREHVGDPMDLQAGANIAGFIKVADSVIQQGCV